MYWMAKLSSVCGKCGCFFLINKLHSWEQSAKHAIWMLVKLVQYDQIAFEVYFLHATWVQRYFFINFERRTVLMPGKLQYLFRAKRVDVKPVRLPRCQSCVPTKQFYESAPDSAAIHCNFHGKRRFKLPWTLLRLLLKHCTYLR